MTTKSKQNFDIRFPVAFGAGLATALLVLGARQQASLAAKLFTFLAPLPIMIATLGFGRETGLGAAVVGAITVAALIVSTAAMTISAKTLVAAVIAAAIFALVFTLPSWWLARLAGSGRPAVILPWLVTFLRRVTGRPAAEPAGEGLLRTPCPFGDILGSAAAIVFVVASTMILIAVLREPSYQAGLAKATAVIKLLIVKMSTHRELPEHTDLAALAAFFVHILPPIMSAFAVLMFLVNLWLAGRVVQLSHRLIHPWPDVAHNLQVPRIAAPLFVICLGLAFLSNLGGMIASVAAAVLGTLFVLQGLAVLHDFSRGLRFRPALLFGLYLAVAFSVAVPWPLLIIALIGLAEAAFSLRARKAAQDLNIK